jgi:hypothetical protein
MGQRAIGAWFRRRSLLPDRPDAVVGKADRLVSGLSGSDHQKACAARLPLGSSDAMIDGRLGTRKSAPAWFSR